MSEAKKVTAALKRAIRENLLRRIAVDIWGGRATKLTADFFEGKPVKLLISGNPEAANIRIGVFIVVNDSPTEPALANVKGVFIPANNSPVEPDPPRQCQPR